MSLNFADIASKKIDDIERPALPPVGTYRFAITKLPDPTTTADGNWDILTVSCRALEALDDVDMSDYKGEVTGIMQQVKFMFNKNDEAEFGKSEYRMRQFFEKHVGCAEAGATVGQMLNASINGQFLGSLVWRADKNDPELFHANIGRTAPVE